MKVRPDNAYLSQEARQAKRRRKDGPEIGLDRVVATIAGAARVATVVTALKSYDQAELKSGPFPKRLADALVDAAKRINKNFPANHAQRLNVERVETALGSHVEVPESLQNLTRHGGNPLEAAYAQGDVYVGFGPPRDALLQCVFKSDPSRLATAYIDPALYAWIIDKGLAREGRSRWFVTQQRHSLTYHTDFQERGTNGVGELAEKFDQYIKAFDGKQRDKIYEARDKFVREVDRTGNDAGSALDLLVKRLCKAFIDFTVHEGHKVHVVTDNVEWDTLGVKGPSEGPLFTPSEFKRLSALPEEKTKYYFQSRLIEPPHEMATLRKKLQERRAGLRPRSPR